MPTDLTNSALGYQRFMQAPPRTKHPSAAIALPGRKPFCPRGLGPILNYESVLQREPCRHCSRTEVQAPPKISTAKQVPRRIKCRTKPVIQRRATLQAFGPHITPVGSEFGYENVQRPVPIEGPTTEVDTTALHRPRDTHVASPVCGNPITDVLAIVISAKSFGPQQLSAIGRIF